MAEFSRCKRSRVLRGVDFFSLKTDLRAWQLPVSKLLPTVFTTLPCERKYSQNELVPVFTCCQPEETSLYTNITAADKAGSAFIYRTFYTQLSHL